MTADDMLTGHRDAGRVIDVSGLPTFVREEGDGPAVLLVHGVPVSSWVWRRMLPELADGGVRAVAPDLPGLGLSGRPADFDWSWSGLGAHLAAVVDALDLDTVHLVVHDIGGPVGFEVAARMPDRVRCLTVLDTIVEAHTFHKPWVMRPFGLRGIGEAWLAATPRPMFRLLMRRIGLLPDTTVTAAEIDVHHRLLRHDDGGRAFLQIMRSFETTRDKTALYANVLAHDRPVQVVWATDDPALPARTLGRTAAAAAGLDGPDLVPGRHFLQEDSPTAITERILALDPLA